MPDLSYSIDLNQDKVIAKFVQEGKSASGQFYVDLTKDNQPFEASLALRQYNLREFFSSAVYKDPRNFAYVTLDFKSKGELAQFKLQELFLSINSLYGEYYSSLSDQAKILDLKLENPIA